MQIIKAFVKHFGQTRSIKRHKHMYHAYLETPSVVSMLIKYGYYDGVELGNTDENMYKSAGVSYVNNDMVKSYLTNLNSLYYLTIL